MIKESTINRLTNFVINRKWEKYHTPENLAKAISIEANELLKCYQWGDDWEYKTNVKEEIADILIYCVYYCKRMEFDIDKIINEKIDKNKEKYPCK